MPEAEYLHAITEAESRWFEGVIADLTAGTLTWSWDYLEHRFRPRIHHHRTGFGHVQPADKPGARTPVGTCSALSTSRASPRPDSGRT
ncbi:hypothetical protein [Nocardia sp. NPDC051463]|uniref:hypothetical protein n=1 Tax=Nocardia sp. NPDC051463 TaxID=3154845 RepID=UPI003444F809